MCYFKSFDIKCLFFSFLLGNLTWVIFRPIFFSYEKQGMIFFFFQNILSQGSFAVVIWICYCGDLLECIYRGVNLVAALNWNVKNARVEGIFGAFVGWAELFVLKLSLKCHFS